jgi:hypothetical protein
VGIPLILIGARQPFLMNSRDLVRDLTNKARALVYGDRVPTGY